MFGVYRYIDNWHKHPWLAPILCKIGRHDYEVIEVTGARSAILMCFYCEKKKHSEDVSR